MTCRPLCTSTYRLHRKAAVLKVLHQMKQHISLDDSECKTHLKGVIRVPVRWKLATLGSSAKNPKAPCGNC